MRQLKKSQVAIALKLILTFALFWSILLASTMSFAKTFYLDAQLTSNCTSGNYSIANRNCTGSDGDAYNNLQDAITALAGGDTLYSRGGTYIRTTNDSSVGSLAIAVSGTSAQHTVVRGYNGELPVICTQSGKCQYNPNPGDTSFTNSSHYYPNPAISIGGNYIDVIGFKTYGQVFIGGIHDVTVQDSDLGGGGPHINQGNVVIIDTTASAYAITIKNNKIHHSSWGESNINGAAVMGYNFSATVENNEFYDNWGPDIRLKDTGNQQGRSIEIRNNFFRSSSLRANEGVEGIGQDGNIDYIYIHNNIFYNKSTGIVWDISPLKSTIVYNNTFINCSVDISQWMTGIVMNMFNNLHYHTTSNQKYYDFQANTSTELDSNYNLFYSTASTSWYNLNSNRGTTLLSWQTYSADDLLSVSKNPNFVNAGANRPEDFKRTSYAGDVTGSVYGTVAGAYETGNEIIGVTAGSLPSDTTPPSSPTGLRVN